MTNGLFTSDDFGMSLHKDGQCYVRLDDLNKFVKQEIITVDECKLIDWKFDTRVKYNINSLTREEAMMLCVASGMI